MPVDRPGPAAVPAPVRRRQPQDLRQHDPEHAQHRPGRHRPDRRRREPAALQPSRLSADLHHRRHHERPPPHIAQIIAGHQDINVTLGYKAVYPDEAIQAHLAFLARRRSLRPSDEYRVPTDEEWTEFLGHFERRKVSIGTCARAFSTPCIHEHACVRCSMLWPDPTQRPRLIEIRDNLKARIAEAEREAWLGEIEGLKVSLTGAEDKLTQIDQRPHRATTVHLGFPILTAPPIPTQP